MAKLGTKKRPAIVHVETEARAGEIMEICESHGWQVIVGIEPDKPDFGTRAGRGFLSA